jgi:hypothetical protein
MFYQVTFSYHCFSCDSSLVDSLLRIRVRFFLSAGLASRLLAYAASAASAVAAAGHVLRAMLALPSYLPCLRCSLHVCLLALPLLLLPASAPVLRAVFLFFPPSLTLLGVLWTGCLPYPFTFSYL